MEGTCWWEGRQGPGDLPFGPGGTPVGGGPTVTEPALPLPGPSGGGPSPAVRQRPGTQGRQGASTRLPFL